MCELAFINFGQEHRYTSVLKVTAQLKLLVSKEKPACEFRDFIGSCYSMRNFGYMICVACACAHFKGT